MNESKYRFKQRAINLTELIGVPQVENSKRFVELMFI